MEAPLSDKGSEYADLSDLYYGVVKNRVMPLPPECMDQPRGSLILGHLPEYPLCYAGTCCHPPQQAKKRNDRSFRHMWLTIVLSFAFYIPVVLFADTMPAIGMLMIPKTCAYVWTIVIGFRDMQAQLQRS